jgi:Fe-S oxidoreductase
MYKLPQEAALGIVASSEEKEELAAEIDMLYRCVGCAACVDQCPHGVDLPAIFRAGRRLLVDFGSYPDVLKAVVRRIHDVGNPLGKPREERPGWAEELDVPEFTPGMDLLYFPCCIPSYDPRLRSVAQATAKILNLAGVSFGILGAKETCCGEAIRRIGAEEVFAECAESNTAAITEAGAVKVLVSSPHCFTVFKNDYPGFGARFEAIHVSQFLAQALADGKLKPQKPFAKKVVYHDPCVLGRQNDIYEEPREVLRSVPDLELLEVEDFKRSLSLCCGAGSGGLWMEWEKDERMASIRAQQLMDTGADVIAVACPYCLQMLEETVKSMGSDIPVMDITEILAETL